MWSPLSRRPVPVHPQGPVGVPVVGDADRGARLPHPGGQALGMEGAAAGVDVPAVRRGVEDFDLEAEPAEDPRGQRGARPVGAVDDGLDPGGAGTRLDAADEIVDVVARQAAVDLDVGLVPGQPPPSLEDVGFDLELPFVRDLDPERREDLDAVVFEGVVGGRDDGAGRKAVRLRQEGDGRGRDDAGRNGFSAGDADAAGQGPLHPRPRLARVAPHQDPGPLALALQKLDEGGAETRDGRLIEREVAGHRPHPVGPEELLLHVATAFSSSWPPACPERRGPRPWRSSGTRRTGAPAGAG